MPPRKTPLPRDPETGLQIISKMTGKTGEIALTTLNDAAEYLHVHTNTLRRWADKNLVDVIKLPSGVRRFPIAGIVAAKKKMTEHWEEQL